MRKSRAGRPLKGTEKRVRVSFTLPPQQLSWLKQRGETERASRSEVLERLIGREIAQGSSTRASSEESISVRPGLHLSREKLLDFCRKHAVKRLSLFGSVNRDDFTEESDIDLLVEFFPGEKPGLVRMLSMEQEISEMLNGRKIDLRTPEEIGTHLRPAIARESRVLYG